MKSNASVNKKSFLGLVLPFKFDRYMMGFFLSFASQPVAHGMDWEFRTSSYMSAEGGWLSGSKVPLNSQSQIDYDNESTKTGSLDLAEKKIKTTVLQGVEWLTSASSKLGYEGFSDDLAWQAQFDLIGNAVAGNSSGTFYSPPGDPVFPTQGRGGRNSGWSSGLASALHWVPLSGFSLHMQSSFTTGADSFKQNFSRLHLAPELQIKAAKFVISPHYSWQRLLAADALPAADISAWSLDVEWIGNRFFRFQNPNGFPLIKTWRATTLGSALLVKALENEGAFLEINVTPRIYFSGSLYLTSHFRSVSGSGQSYISPSLADVIQDRGRKTNDWSPPPPSADYSSQTIEWKNSLNNRVQKNLNLSIAVLYTSRSYSFTPSALSKFQYSSLIDAARETSLRYFLGGEFLL